MWAALLTPSVVADLDAQYSGGTAEATEGYTSTDPSDVTLLFICPVEVEGHDMFTFNVQAGAWADVPAGTFVRDEAVDHLRGRDLRGGWDDAARP